MAQSITIIGAGSALGLAAVNEAVLRGATVTATIRTDIKERRTALGALGARVEILDLDDAAQVRRVVGDQNRVLAFPILTRSSVIVDHLKSDCRAVFFSSQNVVVDPGAGIYARLMQAEAEVRKRLPTVTILRPTMIYGHPDDNNISKLMRFMKRWPLTPLPGDGRAGQQPVFYEDVAKIAVDIALTDKAIGDVRALAGPEMITQRELYLAVARALDIKPRLIPLPLRAAIGVAKVFEGVGVRLPVTTAQLRRAIADKSVDAGPQTIFGDTLFEDGARRLALHLGQTLDAARPRT